MSTIDNPPAYVFPPFRLLPAQRELLCADASVKLGGRAFDLLVALVERRDRTVGKGELMDLCWPRLVVEENNLQVQIAALRKLLGHPAIATVPGRGYRFTLPVVEEGHSPRAGPAAGEVSMAEERRVGNLRPGLPTLYGRAEELRELQGLVEREALVTVAGSAGIGKTRLAQAAAATHAMQPDEAVWWVDLAPLADPALVPGAVALALGLPLDGAANATVAVSNALRAERALLVLDNAEHLLDGVAAFVSRLRHAAPQLRLLVTSQEPLHLEDEHVFRPEPLALPDGDDPARIEASAAVELFVARAKGADRRFELGADNRAAVADICRRLDGLPLAIELAAARVPLLGVEGLRDKLDQRFHVLTAGRRAILARHQTLRGALDWSYHLLTPDEQTVLRRLGVFVGGFTLEAAQQVADDGGIDAWDVLEHLGALVDKSLVVADGDALPRYRLLESTRLFALERLIDSGEVNTVRSRHRDHYLEVAEACAKHLPAGDPQLGIRRLDAERDNLLLALAWAPGEEDGLPGLRLAAAMHHYWFLRALPDLGAQVTRAALARPGARAPTLVRCRALVTAGWIGMFAARDDESVPFMDEALLLAHQLCNAHVLCFALAKFAHLRLHRNEDEAARRLASEAVEVGRPLGDCIELGDALVMRAHLFTRAGEGEAARQYLGEALELRRRMANADGQISVLLRLAQLATDEGQPERGQAPLAEALALMPLTDSPFTRMWFTCTVADWAAASGRPGDALLLNATCDRICERIGMVVTKDQCTVERMERSHRLVGDVVAGKMAEAGRALDFVSALQYARSMLDGT